MAENKKGRALAWPQASPLRRRHAPDHLLGTAESGLSVRERGCASPQLLCPSSAEHHRALCSSITVRTGVRMGGWLHPYLRRERSVLRVEAHQTMVGPAYAHSDSTSESEESTDLGDEISLGIMLQRHDDAAFHHAAVGSTTGAWTDSPYLRLVPTTPPLRPPPLPQQRRRLRTPSRSPPRRARRMAPPPVPPLRIRPAPQTPPAPVTVAVAARPTHMPRGGAIHVGRERCGRGVGNW